MTEHDEGHRVTPHDHAWQVRVWGFVARCSGRYFCSTCWRWVGGERCDLADRDRYYADRRIRIGAERRRGVPVIDIDEGGLVVAVRP